MPRLILASSSPRRSEILTRLAIPFTIVPADVEEHTGKGMTARDMVLHNSRRKGLKVSGRFPESIVLAADTTVFVDDRILNKPRDLDEARDMLRALSGRDHQVVTGVFVTGPSEPRELEFAVESRVTFRSLDDARIASYFDRVDPLDKAGAYAIQEAAELIVEGYDGSFTNIMGLPEEETGEALKKFGLSGR